MPLVSFVVPFYGSASLLGRCLESMVAQTDGDFEAIVIDDCSREDGEAETVRRGVRFRYFRQPRNASSFQARLRGIAEARGDYIVAVDADDYVLPNLVAEIRAAARKNPDIIVYNLERDEGGCIFPHWCRHTAETLTAREALCRLTGKRLQWNLCAKAIRRDLCVATIGRQDLPSGLYINVSDDFATFLPILLDSRTVVLIDYAGYRYVQNEGSLCHGLCSWRSHVRAVWQTLRAGRVVLRFIVRERKGGFAALRALRILWMILKWEVWEFGRALRGKGYG